MRENDIRPEELRKKQQKYIKEDVKNLLSNRKSFVLVNCPACNSNTVKKTLKKNGFNYIECSNCGMLYMSPRPTKEILSNFYKNSVNYKFFNEYIFPATKVIRKQRIFLPRIKCILKVCKEKKIQQEAILEIGSAFGIFCEEIVKRKYFKNVVAIEATDALYMSSFINGVKVYNGLFEDLKIVEKFDVAVAFEVLEHVFSPFQFLKKLFLIMKDNSIVMLTMPNYDGFDIGVLGKNSVSIDHEHLNYFTPHSITLLLTKIGFSEVEVSTPGELDVDLVKNAIQTKKIKTNHFIEKLCSDKNSALQKKFQKFLKENNLSSHMMVIASKKGN